MAIKTEHNGAKNGGGHWGTRAEAKEVSNHLRREEGRAIVRGAKALYEPRNPVVQYVDEYGDTQTIHSPKGRGVRHFKGLNTPALRMNRAVAALLGERVKERRLALGLTLAQVGVRAGLASGTPKNYIHAIESAGNPNRRTEGVRLGTLYALAYALECHPSELLPTPQEVMDYAGVKPADFVALAA